MKEKLKKCLYNNSKKILVLFSILLVGCAPTSTKTNQEILDKHEKILREADALYGHGESAKAIVRYKKAIDLLQSRTLSVSSKEEFLEKYRIGLWVYTRS